MGNRPFLKSWWDCCKCSRDVDLETFGDSCPDCGHKGCGECRGFAGSPNIQYWDQPPAKEKKEDVIDDEFLSNKSKEVPVVEKPAPNRRGRPNPTKNKEPGELAFQSNNSSAAGTGTINEDIPYMQPADGTETSLNALTLDEPGHLQPDVENVNSRFRTVTNYFVWVSSLLWNPPPRLGWTRVSWKCACGANLYDDYVELKEGAAEELQTELRKLCNRPYIRQHWTTTAVLREALDGISVVLKTTIDVVAGTYRRLTNKGRVSNNPAHGLESQLQPPQQSDQAENIEKQFLLLCIGGSTGTSATRAYQPTVHDVDSDRTLFRRLTHYYTTIRKRWWSFISLWELQQIHFVHFDLYEKSLVDIKEVNVLPAPEFTAQYRYEPSKLKPPIGSNLLMHYLHCPEEASELAPCLRKMPKKLNDELVACSINGVSPGWGLHFEEGWSWKKILTGLCFLLISAGILEVVLYWRFEHSAQDSLALGSFMVACFSVVIATLQAWLTTA